MNRWVMIIFIALILTLSKTLLAQGRSPAVTCEGSEISYNEVKELLKRYKFGDLKIIEGEKPGRGYAQLKGVPKDCAAMLEPKDDLRGEETHNFLAKPPVENKSPHLANQPKFNNYGEAFIGQKNFNCDTGNVNFQTAYNTYSKKNKLAWKDDLWNCYFESELQKFLSKDPNFIRETGRALNQKPWTRQFPKLNGYKGFQACIEFHDSVRKNYKKSPLLELEENYQAFKKKFTDSTDVKIPIATTHFTKENKMYTYENTKSPGLGCKTVVEIDQTDNEEAGNASVTDKEDPDCFDCSISVPVNKQVTSVLDQAAEIKNAVNQKHLVFRNTLSGLSAFDCSDESGFKNITLTGPEKQQFVKSIGAYNISALKHIEALKNESSVYTDDQKAKIKSLSKYFQTNSLGRLYASMDENQEKELMELYRMKSKIDALSNAIDEGASRSKLANIAKRNHDFFKNEERENMLQCKSLEKIHENDCKNFTEKATADRLKYLKKIRDEKKVASDAEVSVSLDISKLPLNIYALDLKEIEPKITYDKPGDINTEIKFLEEKLNKVKSSGLDCISNEESFNESDYSDRITKLSTPVEDEDEAKVENKKYDELAKVLEAQTQMLQQLMQGMMMQNQNLSSGISGGQGGAYAPVMGMMGMDSMNYMSSMMMNMYSGFSQSMLNMQSSQLDMNSQMQQMNFNNQYMLNMYSNPYFGGNAGWGGASQNTLQPITPSQTTPTQGYGF
jgi:hypothetical protein